MPWWGVSATRSERAVARHHSGPPQSLQSRTLAADADAEVLRVTDQSVNAGTGRAAKAASRTLDILEFVGQRSLPAPAVTIAAACGIPRSTLRELLRMLEGRGYLAYKPAEKGWAPGRRLLGPRVDTLEFEHGVAVLELFGTGGGGLSVEDIVSRSGLSQEMAGRILTALAGFGLVVPVSDGTFSLGRRLLGLASRIGWVEGLQLAARPALTRLRDESGETASLLLEDAGQALYLDQVESRFDLRCRGWVGRRVRLDGTSVGAAFADPSRPHVVANAVEAGVTAIACAVGGIEPAVGVSIIGPTWRLEDRGLDQLVEIVRATAGELGDAYATDRDRLA
jgi:DNA-binding IclR family transcriptional regulator